MAEPIWERKFRGENIALSLEDFTVHRLREIKSFFGEDYGIPSKFISLLLMGEVDALTAALWVNGQKTGNPIGDPLRFEFNLADFAEPDPVKRPAKKKPDPTQAATKAETGLSATLTSSDAGSFSS